METPEIFPAPTYVMCQDEPNWNNGVFIKEGEAKVDISDKDWVSKQFYKLNDRMNVTIEGMGHMFNLIVGNNTLKQAIPPPEIPLPDLGVLFEVKEFINPGIGLCYAIITDQEWTSMEMDSLVYVRLQFSQAIEKPILSAYLISQEDWYGFLLPDFGRLKPFKVSLPGLKTLTWIGTEMKRYEKLQTN